MTRNLLEEHLDQTSQLTQACSTEYVSYSQIRHLQKAVGMMWDAFHLMFQKVAAHIVKEKVLLW